MGPFKHTVDDGLDIRKAAFECMYTLLDSCLDRLDIFEFLNHVEDGLKDHYDIKVSCHFSLCRQGFSQNTLNSEQTEMVKILLHMLKYFTIFAIFIKLLLKRLHTIVRKYLPFYVLSITD